MKFMVAVDCEGPACVVGQPNKGLSETPNFAFAKLQATREADAAARALFDAGARKVVVWDNHGGSPNLDYDLLDERCDILLGTGPGRRWPCLDESYAGVLMVGYHPMDNTVDGVLAHSFSSKAYQWMKVNDVEVGEIEIDAACAGLAGVPLIFVASDDKGVTEAKRFMPWVEGVATKQGLAWNMALSKHPKRAVKDIYDGVARAVARIGEMKSFTFESPAKLTFRYKRLEGAQGAARNRQGWKRIDPYTVERTVQRIDEQW
jgi:D-amino peptidase